MIRAIIILIPTLVIFLLLFNYAGLALEEYFNDGVKNNGISYWLAISSGVGVLCTYLFAKYVLCRKFNVIEESVLKKIFSLK